MFKVRRATEPRDLPLAKLPLEQPAERFPKLDALALAVESFAFPCPVDAKNSLHGRELKKTVGARLIHRAEIRTMLTRPRELSRVDE